MGVLALEPVGGEIVNIDWQTTENYYGAFKLNYPGQDPALQKAYFQFFSTYKILVVVFNLVPWLALVLMS